MTEATPSLGASLACPLCDYDLRGLTSRRCPECGHAFDLAQLQAARDERRSETFEHSGRPVLAFLDSAMRSLWPIGFWRRLSPAVPIVPRRLVAWAIVWLLAAVAWSILMIAPPAVDAYRDAHALRTFPSNPRFGATSVTVPLHVSWGMPRYTWIDAAGAVMSRREPPASAVRLVLAATAWPLATFLASCAFAVTLRRAGVRRGHLARVALYGWPGVMLAALLLGTAMTAFRWEGYRHARFFPAYYTYWLDQVGLSPAAGACLLALAFLSTLSVAAAHVRYLRLPAAFVQSLLVSAVSWLMLATLLLASRQLL